VRLSEEEQRTLRDLIPAFAKPNSVVGFCAYGSKVAGYARKDSDYDLIVVVKKFREGVRYKYLDEPVAASALIVDEGLFHQDGRASSLGEFVVGRLLNIHEPIINQDLFLSVELVYKRRVIMESLLELSADYGDFCRHIFVPFEYFLFEKLRKRSIIYPPALYSYVMTYTCPLGGENRAISVDGFRKAAEALSPQGYFTLEREGVRIVPKKLKGDAFTKVQSIFALTTRGVTQYAVHGYAGRVGLSVFRKEAESKLRRMRDNPEPLPELEQPRMLLQLEEGRLIPDASRLEKELAEIMGMTTHAIVEKLIGDPYSTTRVLTFKDQSGEVSVVLKNFSDIRSLKWALLGVWAAAANRFSMSPLSRLEREYAMTGSLRSAGVKVPKIIAVSPDVRILVKSYVQGPTLSKVIDDYSNGRSAGLTAVAEYGRLMSVIHNSGYALGDAKASNVVVSSDGLYLTDLEQSDPNGDKAWDLAEFIYYTAKLTAKQDAMNDVARTFLDSYAKSGAADILAKAASPKYLRPFLPFLLPTMTRSLRDLFNEYA
jgi:tRNA A-37 threonylcarbamoyl transferase component Bud32/predicted nucleotidyltransferase